MGGYMKLFVISLIGLIHYVKVEQTLFLFLFMGCDSETMIRNVTFTCEKDKKTFF
jgi:hypothetical protein